MKDNQAKYPQLRFKGFTYPWEKRKLGKWFAERTERSGEGEMLSVTISSGVVRANSLDRKDNSSTDKSNYKVVHIGDIAYNSMRMWQAASGVSNYDGIVSPAYTVLVPAAEVSSVFFGYQFKQTKMKQIFQRNSQGLTSDTWNLKYPLLAKIKTSAPQKTEQVKIGTFFATLDHLIAVNQRKLAKLKELKQGYLQKLFPENGSKFPQLRFAGFADAWEQRKFESLLNKNDGIRRGPFGSALKKEFFVPKSEYVVYEQQNAIYDNYKTRYNITKKKFDELSRFELRPNDFIMSGAGTIGRISRVPNDIKKGVFNQALIRFRINTSITDSEYFVQFIRADFMQRKLTNANPGSAITNLVPMSEVKKWIIQFPNLKEQQKIGTFFQQLDHLITLHQRKLEKLQELKKGYLQKMFC